MDHIAKMLLIKNYFLKGFNFFFEIFFSPKIALYIEKVDS
jgi:hypothetical protein